jgi:hypothetical protein
MDESRPARSRDEQYRARGQERTVPFVDIILSPASNAAIQLLTPSINAGIAATAIPF